jgi:hypothetical protein
MKDKAMLEDFGDDAMFNCHELSLATNQPFISLLELISEIYQVQHSSNPFSICFSLHF